MTGEEATMIWLEHGDLLKLIFLGGCAASVGLAFAELIRMVARHLWRRAWGL